MKKFKILILLLFIIGSVGCTSQNNSETPKDIVANDIAQYKYSDEFFNYNWSQDKNGNCYFDAGMYFYQLDQQQNLTKLFYRLIDEKYWIHDIKYYDGTFYCLVLKVNHDYGNAPLGLATIDINGQNFQYLNDLIYADIALHFNIVNMRIDDHKIYVLDLYSEESAVYTYSLISQKIEEKQSININQKRYEFYKKSFPDYPYNEISHVYNKNFYSILFSKKEQKFIQYDPITNAEKQYDLSQYYDPSNQKVGLFYIDFACNHWFLFSSKGVFMFDSHFENEKQLLDDSIFDQTYNITTKNNIFIFETQN